MTASNADPTPPRPVFAQTKHFAQNRESHLKTVKTVVLYGLLLAAMGATVFCAWWFLAR